MVIMIRWISYLNVENNIPGKLIRLANMVLDSVAEIVTEYGSRRTTRGQPVYDTLFHSTGWGDTRKQESIR